MPCYNPIAGWKGNSINLETGKRPIVFQRKDAFNELMITIPCGDCEGCMIDISRQWAVRCITEAQTHIHNSFVTLTYRDEDLPMDGSLHKPDLQNFIKNLRQHQTREAKRLKKKTGANIQPDGIRYFACGEYGPNKMRPHYHALLFGVDFMDKEYWKEGSDGDSVYISKTLEKLWGKGFCTCGSITGRSAGYVARYVGKKFDGKKDPDVYKRETHDETREPFYYISKEFGLMSKKPGIGKPWFDKYANDCRKDFLMIEGNKVAIPKYYKTLMEEYDKEVEKKNKRERKRKRKELEKRGEFTERRLNEKRKVKNAQIKLLKRGAEDAKS